MSEKEKSELYTKQKNLSFETRIKKRPWEHHPKNIGQIYQCYCKKLKIVKEKDTIKLNRTGLSNGKPLRYQNIIDIQLDGQNKSEGHFQLSETSLTGQFLKTFQIQCKFPLSLAAHSLLLSFTNKYIYYAIDDILYLSTLNPIERDRLLDILCSPMISLQSDFSINFFDIWIDSVYLNTDSITNRFLQKSFHSISETTITLRLHYFTRTPIKKPEPLW